LFHVRRSRDTPERKKEVSEVPGLGWRISLSIIGGIAWLIFLILWFFFFAVGFTLYQNIAILIVSIAVVGVLEGFTWVPMWWQAETPGYGRMVSVNLVLGLIISVFIVIWLFFFADAYTLYKNISMLVIPLALWGIIQSITRRKWARAEPWISTGRYALGLIVTLAWGVFLFIWFYYYAEAYAFFENVLVFILSAVIMGAAQGLAHAPWRQVGKAPGLGWRVALSAVMGVGWVVFVVLWLMFFASGFSVLQNLAIISISLLVMAAILGAAWAPWAIKYGGKHTKK
jgi:hypothetical protein